MIASNFESEDNNEKTKTKATNLAPDNQKDPVYDYILGATRMDSVCKCI